MTLDLDAGGRQRTVNVRRVGDGWIVGVDGREASVSAAESGGRWSLLVGFKSYEVTVEPLRHSETVITVNGRAVVVSRVGRGGARSRRGHHGSLAAGGPTRIVAPMPGRIVKVLVRPGETVAARQGLVVVEAMKMENELRAPSAGTVRAVRVTEGAAVEANSVLIEIE